MNEIQSLKKIIACPNCKCTLRNTNGTYFCHGCLEKYNSISNIPILFIANISPKITEAKKGYEKLHAAQSHKITDGSYDVLASIARGNRTLDIACGDGFIEELSPNTVGVDFSLSALKKARKKGAKHLVCASSEDLPFIDNSFDVSICAGSLEHFPNPQKALQEMARVSRIQIVTVHRPLPIPFSNTLRKSILKLKGITDQPIDNPLPFKRLKKYIENAGLTILFHGVWTQPFNFEMVFKSLPKKITQYPSCNFIISIKH